MIFHHLVDWLSRPKVVAVFGTLASIIAIITALDKLPKTLWPSGQRVAHRLVCAISATWNRLRLRPALTCIRMRWTVLFGDQMALIEGARRALEGTSASELEIARSDLAKVLAFIGRVEDATSIDPCGAAWGLAMGRGPQEALSIVESRKHVEASAFYTWQALADICRDLDTPERVDYWCHSRAATSPIVAIANEFAKLDRFLKWPACLNDVADYIQSEPACFVGWVRVRDFDILRPIDEERFHALRWMSARASPCTALPKIAANLAILADAKVIFRSAPT